MRSTLRTAARDEPSAPIRMIIGSGFVAQSFASRYADDPATTIFASGVSNSRETRDNEFEREHTLLLKSLEQHRGDRFVYFGSCGVAERHEDLTPYMQHKKRMESLVLNSPNGLVLRLPQVVGISRNVHTLANFLYARILSGQHFAVWSNAERNLIGIDDVVAIGAVLIDEAATQPRAVPIASVHSLTMPEIVSVFERVLGRKASYSIEPKGSPLRIDTGRAVEIASRLGIDLGYGYTEHVIRKYYSPTD